MDGRFECQIGSEQPGEPRIVTIRGEVDLASAPELESCVRGVFSGEPSSIVLDLEALTFIDSSGLRVLVALAKDARSIKTPLILRNVPRHAQRVLDLTGLSEWFAPPADS